MQLNTNDIPLQELLENAEPEFLEAMLEQLDDLEGLFADLCGPTPVAIVGGGMKERIKDFLDE